MRDLLAVHSAHPIPSICLGSKYPHRVGRTSRRDESSPLSARSSIRFAGKPSSTPLPFNSFSQRLSFGSKLAFSSSTFSARKFRNSCSRPHDDRPSYGNVRLSSNANAGAVFVFGKTYQDHFFVFKVDSRPRSFDPCVTLSIEGDVDHHLSRINHQCPLLSRCDAVHYRQDCLAHATMFEYNGSRGSGKRWTM